MKGWLTVAGRRKPPLATGDPPRVTGKLPSTAVWPELRRACCRWSVVDHRVDHRPPP
ncbi:hypothetical protein A2U01_0077742 [Trifolium medium]|uniref:Uncharacterized protein n=1 Tax=Trifolium medium TaxID=97028 RepID=A0A392T5W7_9FABA|nr:hypothetical protein [Trifolium medium]